MNTLNTVTHLLAAEGGEAEFQVLAIPLSELIIGLVAFFVVFGLLAKLALPGIRKALDERTAAIEGGIAQAEVSQAEAEALKVQYQALLAEARTEAARSGPRRRRTSPRSSRRPVARPPTPQRPCTPGPRRASPRSAPAPSRPCSVRSATSRSSLAGKVVQENLSDDARARATVDRFLADLEAKAAVAEAAR